MVALKSVPWLSAKPTGIVCHEAEAIAPACVGLGIWELRASGSCLANQS